MSRIAGLFKGSQGFSSQQLGHSLLHYLPLTRFLLKAESSSKSVPRLFRPFSGHVCYFGSTSSCVKTCTSILHCRQEIGVRLGDLRLLRGKSFLRAWWELQNPWLGWHGSFCKLAPQKDSLVLAGKGNGGGRKGGRCEGCCQCVYLLELAKCDDIPSNSLIAKTVEEFF